MKGISKVMACIDLSDYSRLTIEYMLAIIAGTKAEILLYHVINKKDIDYLNESSQHFSGKFNVDTYIKRVTAERHQLIRTLLETHFPADMATMDILIHVGVPFDAILKTIEAEKVDFVVIASKGKSNLRGTLFGSNAEKVFRHATVPVLSVRNRERFSRNQ